MIEMQSPNIRELRCNPSLGWLDSVYLSGSPFAPRGSPLEWDDWFNHYALTPIPQVVSQDQAWPQTNMR